MKKYFKLGTVLAFSVLVNLTPTLNVNAKTTDVDSKEEIVENINQQSNSYSTYAGEFYYDDSNIIEEEPLTNNDIINNRIIMPISDTTYMINYAK